jgi:hypothetical protein
MPRTSIGLFPVGSASPPYGRYGVSEKKSGGCGNVEECARLQPIRNMYLALLVMLAAFRSNHKVGLSHSSLA